MSWFSEHLVESAVCALLALALPILYTMLFSSRNKFPVEGLTAVVTGGSQGLGLSIAQELSARGANVVLVARDTAKLDAAVKTLQSRAQNPQSQRFLHLSYDLRLAESAPKILQEIKTWNNGEAPDLIFCCAGYCYPSFFADAPVEQLKDQMDGVYWSSAYMAHAAINMWKIPSSNSQQKPSALSKPKPTRHIIFTCSALAFFPVAGYTPYTVCKAAMRTLADSLHQELEVYNGSRQQGPSTQGRPVPDADMKVHILFPMGIVSPGFENENKIKPALTLKLEKDDKPQEPDEIAKIALARLGAGDFMITTMFLGHLMRGCGMAGTVRSSLMDVFWNWLGSIVIIFVAPDFLKQCRNWGKKMGMNATVHEV